MNLKAQESGIKAVLFIILFFPCYRIFAQKATRYEDNKLMERFFNDLYDFSFTSADSMIAELSKAGTEKATIFNLKANLAWWRLLTGDEPLQTIKTCNSNIDESINSLSQAREPDQESNLNLVYSYSLRARLENFSGNRLKSLVSFYKSSGYIKKCIDTPDKEKTYLALGLYLYFADYIEKEYFISKPLFLSLPRGDRTLGLKYLNTCSVSENEMISTEANYFLMKIFTYVEKNYPEANKSAAVLTRQHPRNMIYRTEQLKVLFLLKKTNEAGTYRQRLIKEIETATYLSTIQKNHFISQIHEIKSDGN